MKKMIQAEDILMGTKSSRHYAAHTGSWISIIAATRTRQSQLPRGEGPGLAAARGGGGGAVTANYCQCFIYGRIHLISQQ